MRSCAVENEEEKVVVEEEVEAAGQRLRYNRGVINTLYVSF